MARWQSLHTLFLPGQLEPGWSNHCFRGELKAMLNVHHKHRNCLSNICG